MQVAYPFLYAFQLVVGTTGLEPMTYRLWAGGSTIWAKHPYGISVCFNRVTVIVLKHELVY